MKRIWMIGCLVGALALGGVAFVQVEGGAGGAGTETGGAGGSLQPIAFPHNLHAGSGEGQANMNCQFCHYSAERSVDAGLPSVATCWGCHQMIPGRTHPEEVQKIQAYLQAGEPIPWVRKYKIADHAHFPHMRHINAGLECQQCHGQIQEIGPEGIQTRSGIARSLFGVDPGIGDNGPVWGGGNMGWCIDCHRQPNEAGEEQASTDCAVCHY